MLAFNGLETGMLARKNCPSQSPWQPTEKLPTVDREPKAQGEKCLVTVRQQIRHQGGRCPLTWRSTLTLWVLRAWPGLATRPVPGVSWETWLGRPGAPISCCTFSRPCWRPDVAVAEDEPGMRSRHPLGNGELGLWAGPEFYSYNVPLCELIRTPRKSPFRSEPG